VIATSTKLDISGVKLPANINDKYFKRSKQKRAKKVEGDIFSTKKEVRENISHCLLVFDCVCGVCVRARVCVVCVCVCVVGVWYMCVCAWVCDVCLSFWEGYYSLIACYGCNVSKSLLFFDTVMYNFFFFCQKYVTVR